MNRGMTLNDAINEISSFAIMMGTLCACILIGLTMLAFTVGVLAAVAVEIDKRTPKPSQEASNLSDAPDHGGSND